VRTGAQPRDARDLPALSSRAGAAQADPPARGSVRAGNPELERMRSSSPSPRASAESSRRGGAIPIAAVSKPFQESATAEVLALDDIHLDIPANSFVSLLGPSGCGKSTLLRLIAGIESPSNGTVSCGGAPVSGVNTGLAYVPQGRGLFPWMTLLT